MGEIADDHIAQLDDDRARGYRSAYRPRPARPRPPEPRWFTIEVTRELSAPCTQYECRFEAKVLATTPSEAMKKLRPDFMHFHFNVLDA